MVAVSHDPIVQAGDQTGPERTLVPGRSLRVAGRPLRTDLGPGFPIVGR